MLIASQALTFAFARPGGLMLWVSDVGLLFCGPCLNAALHSLLASCRLQQRLSLHGAIPDIGFGGEGQIIGLKVV